MNLDENQVQQMSIKKEEILAAQQERKFERQVVDDKVDKKKKKKSKKNKGLKAFAEGDDDEFAKYSKSVSENTKETNIHD